MTFDPTKRSRGLAGPLDRATPAPAEDNAQSFTPAEHPADPQPRDTMDDFAELDALN
jgi:hypothetical protein